MKKEKVNRKRKKETFNTLGHLSLLFGRRRKKKRTTHTFYASNSDLEPAQIWHLKRMSKCRPSLESMTWWKGIIFCIPSVRDAWTRTSPQQAKRKGKLSIATFCPVQLDVMTVTPRVSYCLRCTCGWQVSYLFGQNEKAVIVFPLPWIHFLYGTSSRPSSGSSWLRKKEERKTRPGKAAGLFLIFSFATLKANSSLKDPYFGPFFPEYQRIHLKPSITFFHVTALRNFHIKSEQNWWTLAKANLARPQFDKGHVKHFVFLSFMTCSPLSQRLRPRSKSYNFGSVELAFVKAMCMVNILDRTWLLKMAVSVKELPHGHWVAGSAMRIEGPTQLFVRLSFMKVRVSCSNSRASLSLSTAADGELVFLPYQLALPNIGSFLIQFALWAVADRPNFKLRPISKNFFLSFPFFSLSLSLCLHKEWRWIWWQNLRLLIYGRFILSKYVLYSIPRRA